MEIDKRELDVLLTYKWQAYVEETLAARGIDVWQEENPYQVIAEKSKEIFTTTRTVLVEHFVANGVPPRIARSDPAQRLGIGYKIYQGEEGWCFEYWERGGCCYAETVDSFAAAVKKAVDDQFPYLAE